MCGVSACSQAPAKQHASALVPSYVQEAAGRENEYGWAQGVDGRVRATAGVVGGLSEGCNCCRHMTRARVCENANDIAALGSYACGEQKFQVQVEDWILLGNWAAVHDVYSHDEEAARAGGMYTKMSLAEVGVAHDDTLNAWAGGTRDSALEEEGKGAHRDSALEGAVLPYGVRDACRRQSSGAARKNDGWKGVRMQGACVVYRNHVGNTSVVAPQWAELVRHTPSQGCLG